MIRQIRDPMKDKFDFRCFKHPSKPVHAVCLNASCRGYRFFCIQCFLDNTTHLELHSNDILEVGQFINEVLTLKDKKMKKPANDLGSLISNRNIIDLFFENQKNILRIEEKYKEYQEQMSRYYNKMLSMLQSKTEKHRSVLHTHIESTLMHLKKRLVEQEWKLRTLSAQDENFLKKDQGQEEFKLPNWQNQIEVERFVEQHLIEDRSNPNPKKQNIADESTRKVQTFLKDLKESLGEQEKVDKYLNHALSRDNLKSIFKESEVLLSSVLRRLNENLSLINGPEKAAKSLVGINKLADNLPLNEARAHQQQMALNEVFTISSSETSIRISQSNFRTHDDDDPNETSRSVSIIMQHTSSRKIPSNKKPRLNLKKNTLKEPQKSASNKQNRAPQRPSTTEANLKPSAHAHAQGSRGQENIKAPTLKQPIPKLRENNQLNVVNLNKNQNIKNTAALKLGLGSKSRAFLELESNQKEINFKPRAVSPFNMLVHVNSEADDNSDDGLTEKFAKYQQSTKKQKMVDYNEPKGGLQNMKQIPSAHPIKDPVELKHKAQKSLLEKHPSRPTSVAFGKGTAHFGDLSKKDKPNEGQGMFNCSLNSILSLVFEKPKPESTKHYEQPSSKGSIKQMQCEVKSLQTDHAEGVTSIVFLSDTTIATGSLDATIKLWDTRTFENTKTLQGHKFSITCLKTIKNLKSHGPGLLAHYEGSWNSGEAMSFKEEETLLLSGSTDFEIKLWDPFGKEEALFTFVGHYQMVTSIAVLGRIGDTKSRYFVSGSKDKKIKVWDFEHKYCVNTINEHQEGVFALAYDKQKDLLASSSLDGMILLWRVQSGDNGEFRKLILKSKLRAESPSAVYSLAFQDSSRLYAGDADGRLTLWNCESDLCLWTKQLLNGTIYAVDVVHGDEGNRESQRKAYAITAGTKGKFAIVELGSLEKVGQFDGCQKFSEQFPFGEILVTRSEEEEDDQAIRILSVCNGSSDVYVMQPKLI